MSENVIIIVADDNYLPHAKSLMVNCRRQGGWQGDFCIVMPQDADATQIESRGIRIYRVPDKGFMAKFWIFSDFFRKWSNAIYLDCDILIQGALSRLLDALRHRRKPIIAALEDGPALLGWKHWDKKTEEHKALYEELDKLFPHIHERMMNTAVLLFQPEEIPADTVKTLGDLQGQYAAANPVDEGGTDQQIIHLLLYPLVQEVPDKLFCFWGSDEPQSRVESHFRRWIGNEEPVLLHYCRWYAPWIVKTPDQEAYKILRLDRVCHELYAENLTAFEQEFPKR